VVMFWNGRVFLCTNVTPVAISLSTPDASADMLAFEGFEETVGVNEVSCLGNQAAKGQADFATEGLTLLPTTKSVRLDGARTAPRVSGHNRSRILHT